MEETAGGVARWRVRRYGDLAAVVTECEYNFCDMARTLRTGENTFRRPCNFKELRVVKRAHIATCALCAWGQPLYRIGRTNIATWRRPTELFRARLIHHSRSWLHLQSYRFGYSKHPRCGCRLVTFGALPAPSTIYREIIMPNNHRFWGHASGPSSSSA